MSRKLVPTLRIRLSGTDFCDMHNELINQILASPSGEKQMRWWKNVVCIGTKRHRSVSYTYMDLSENVGKVFQIVKCMWIFIFQRITSSRNWTATRPISFCDRVEVWPLCCYLIKSRHIVPLRPIWGLVAHQQDRQLSNFNLTSSYPWTWSEIRTNSGVTEVFIELWKLWQSEHEHVVVMVCSVFYHRF